MRELAITKKLYDVDGLTELTYPDNDTPSVSVSTSAQKTRMRLTCH